MFVELVVICGIDGDFKEKMKSESKAEIIRSYESRFEVKSQEEIDRETERMFRLLLEEMQKGL